MDNLEANIVEYQGFGEQKYTQTFSGNCRLADNQYELLKERMQHNSSPGHGIGSDDKPLAIDDDIAFYVHERQIIMKLNDVYGRIVAISDLPGVDKVLRPGDDYKVRQPQKRLYRKFRTFLEGVRVRYTMTFRCVRHVLPSTQSQSAPKLVMDRPFPLYLWDDDLRYRLSRVADFGLGRNTARRLYHAPGAASGDRIRDLRNEEVIYLGADSENERYYETKEVPAPILDFIRKIDLQSKIPCCFGSSRWLDFLQHNKCLGPWTAKLCKGHTKILCLEWDLVLVAENEDKSLTYLVLDGTTGVDGGSAEAIEEWVYLGKPRIVAAHLTPIAYGDSRGMVRLLRRAGNRWPTLTRTHNLERKYLINYVLASRLAMSETTNACFSTLKPGVVTSIEGLPTCRELIDVITLFTTEGSTNVLAERFNLLDLGTTYHRELPKPGQRHSRVGDLDKPIVGRKLELCFDGMSFNRLTSELRRAARKVESFGPAENSRHLGASHDKERLQGEQALKANRRQSVS